MMGLESAMRVAKLSVVCTVILLCMACGDDVNEPGRQGESRGDASMPTEGDAPSADGQDSSPQWQPPQGLDVRGPVEGTVTDPLDDAAFVYDGREVRTYELRLSAENLALLDADPRAEQYVEGELLFEGRSYGAVGIRYKGSVGAFRGCTERPDGGAKICRKLSMKVKLNWDDPQGNFHGLRKLQFHSLNNDVSMMKERLGYFLYRSFGVPAPRAVHARLLINGELSGLYALVEQIDGRFTRSRFEEGGKGNLYKELWPLTDDGEPPDAMTIMEQLRTNEDESPSFDGLLSFSAALGDADTSELPAVIERFTDLEHTLRYLAVDRATGNDDGIFHWYCVTGPCWNHNYFWYEEQDAARLWLIPWDLDSGFNVDNRTTTIWYDWDDASLGCEPVFRPPFNLPQRPPVCDKLSGGWAGYQERYLELLQEFLDGPFDREQVEQRLLEWEAQIWPFVVEAADAHDDAVSAEQWQQGRAWLRASIDRLQARARERIAMGPRELEVAGETNDATAP